MHAIGAKLRTRKDEARAAVRRRNGELAELAETAVGDAQRLLVNAKQALRRAHAKANNLTVCGGHDPVAGRRRGRLARAVNDLAELLAATRQIASQTRQRMAGVTPEGATRRVSLHDPDARPIAKGRLGKPVEFGHKAQLVDNDDGVVLDHTVEQGNPADAPQLAPAVKRIIKRTGRKPRTVTADRGYGEHSVDDALHHLGVRNVVIPRKGKPSAGRRAAEHRAGVPPHGEMAHRQRRPDQHPQTRIRLGQNQNRPNRRRPDLGRTRSPRPQPSQDQCPGRMTQPHPG